MKFRFFSILGILLLMFGCSGQKTEQAQQETAQTQTQAAHAGDSGMIQFADFKMAIPDNWVAEAPSSNMRLVQYHLAADSTLQVVGFYFGDQPDMVEANINRWENEFTEIEEEKEYELDNENLTFVSFTGTFKLKPFPMAQDFTEAPDYMTLAAIVSSNEGPYFFKLVGPKETVEKEIDSFKLFLESYEQVASVQ